MHGEHDTELRKELNGSAAWLSGLSPIGSPAPRHTTKSSTLRRPDTHHSPSSSVGGGHTRWQRRAAVVAGPASDGALPPPPPLASLYPHLVRSRSPPSRVPPSLSAGQQLDTSSSNDGAAAATTSASRTRDTFADVLAREWPYNSAHADTPDVVDAVRFGQESALVHYANGGFRDVASRLAPEVGAVSTEAERWRLSAQHSTLQCREAVKALMQAKAELTSAQERLVSLRSEAERRATLAVGVQRGSDTEITSQASPSTASDASVGTLTLQLDQELTSMRTQKQRYEVLCVQKARLEAHLEEWTNKEKKLTAKLERAQVRRSEELEGHLTSARTTRSPQSARAARARPHPVTGSWQRELDVCILERVELLRHLQGGTTQRLEQLKDMLTRLQARTTADDGSDGAAVSHPGSPSRAPAVCATTPLWILDHLTQVHRSVSLGEEAALTEMEHLRVLLQRLQRQEKGDSALRV